MSLWRWYWRFAMQLSTPILATVSVFVFVQGWNSFLLPLIVFFVAVLRYIASALTGGAVK